MEPSNNNYWFASKEELVQTQTTSALLLACESLHPAFTPNGSVRSRRDAS